MTIKQGDLKILDKFEFDIQPVGIKYYTEIPEGIVKLGEKMALCEMLKKAQDGGAFYADADSHTCEAGPYVLGHKDSEEQLINGEYGAGLQAFKDARAASNVYQYIPAMEKGSVAYVAFAPLNKLNFTPDVMIFLADTNQAWILLRAMSYETGEKWSSSFSTVIGCSWMFVHPHKSGEINFISSGLGFGMKRRKLFPENRHFICIPLNKLPSIIRTLSDMPWMPEPFKPDGQEYVKKLRKKLGLD